MTTSSKIRDKLPTELQLEVLRCLPVTSLSFKTKNSSRALNFVKIVDFWQTRFLCQAWRDLVDKNTSLTFTIDCYGPVCSISRNYNDFVKRLSLAEVLTAGPAWLMLESIRDVCVKWSNEHDASKVNISVPNALKQLSEAGIIPSPPDPVEEDTTSAGKSDSEPDTAQQHDKVRLSLELKIENDKSLDVARVIGENRDLLSGYPLLQLTRVYGWQSVYKPNVHRDALADILRYLFMVGKSSIERADALYESALVKMASEMDESWQCETLTELGLFPKTQSWDDDGEDAEMNGQIPFKLLPAKFPNLQRLNLEYVGVALDFESLRRLNKLESLRLHFKKTLSLRPPTSATNLKQVKSKVTVQGPTIKLLSLRFDKYEDAEELAGQDQAAEAPTISFSPLLKLASAIEDVHIMIYTEIVWRAFLEAIRREELGCVKKMEIYLSPSFRDTLIANAQGNADAATPRRGLEQLFVALSENCKSLETLIVQHSQNGYNYYGKDHSKCWRCSYDNEGSAPKDDKQFWLTDPILDLSIIDQLPKSLLSIKLTGILAVPSESVDENGNSCELNTQTLKTWLEKVLLKIDERILSLEAFTIFSHIPYSAAKDQLKKELETSRESFCSGLGVERKTGSSVAIKDESECFHYCCLSCRIVYCCKSCRTSKGPLDETIFDLKPTITIKF